MKIINCTVGTVWISQSGVAKPVQAELEPHDPKYGFGDKSLHGKEHRTCCMNIKDNVAKRVAAFAE